MNWHAMLVDMNATLACETNPDLWFSESQLLRDMAMAECTTCPIKDLCHDLAVRNQEEHGVWGGEDFTQKVYEEPSDGLVLCRAGKHRRPKGQNCKECRRDSQKKYYNKNSTEINRKKEEAKKAKGSNRKKIGDSCANGHLLIEGNIIVRNTDKALLCKKCTHKVKPFIAPKELW